MTTRTQCSRFSMAQWPRIAAAASAGVRAREEMKNRVSGRVAPLASTRISARTRPAGAGQAQLAREAAGAVEPVELAEHAGAALLDAAVALAEVGVGFDVAARSAPGLGEGGRHLGPWRRLVGLDPRAAGPPPGR